jgi:alkaline phosphatase
MKSNNREVETTTKYMRAMATLSLCAMIMGLTPSNVRAQAVKRVESREQWYADGRRAVEEAKRLRAQPGRAKNVILFVGDGMGISTVTAARILEGQERGESGEENLLSFERLPYVALSKTYSVNQQTADSARP